MGRTRILQTLLDRPGVRTRDHPDPNLAPEFAQNSPVKGTLVSVGAWKTPSLKRATVAQMTR